MSEGRLVLVATPIGNLGDLSPRAREVLAEADLVCCEDTRRTRQLLTYCGITGRKLLSVHGHNELARIDEVLGALDRGDVVAVVTDAGTPGVSDPGTRLVAAAAQHGFEVSIVPGPSAAVAALVVSGLPTDRFCFEGFLPRKGGERHRRLAGLAAETRTTVLYEAPPRLGDTMADLAAACGPARRVVVARELTKLHEELWRGTLAEAAKTFSEREPRGEVVIVLQGAPPPTGPLDADVRAALGRRLAAGDSLRDAAAAVAAELGVSRRRAYELAVAERRNAPD
ncbi:MAG: 16S rRNA (cytidine(1402)-2'-O)-methyltransferase [Acidimicrobiales bacterium]